MGASEMEDKADGGDGAVLAAARSGIGVTNGLPTIRELQNTRSYNCRKEKPQ